MIWFKHAFSRQRKIHLGAQPLAVEVAQDIQQPELPTVFQTIRHRIYGPDHVWRFGRGQRIGFVALQPLAWLDPKVQFQFAVNAVCALVVPAIPPDIAQVKKTKTQASDLLRSR